MRLRQLTFLASAISVGIVLAILVIAGVSPEDVLSLGLNTFAVAVGISIIRQLLQGVRFHIVSSGLLKEQRPKSRQSVLVRIGSEFVALVSFSYVGDELVRIAWLSKRGVESGRAAWVAFSERFFDTLVGLSISLLAAAHVWQSGGGLLAMAIVTISLPTLLGSALVVWYLVKGNPKLPRWMGELLIKAFGQNIGSRIRSWAEQAIVNFSAAARELFSQAGARTSLGALLSTIVIHMLPGVALWVIAGAAKAQLGLLPAILAAQASQTLGTLPVTPGGSGLAEAGAALYLNHLLGAHFWTAILVWRIATYHAPLIISAAALLRLTQTGILLRKPANSKRSR